MAAKNQQPGKIVTFYSYKGGTGRSMLLANSAWLLASAGHNVLMTDWDLEAPGLHRYFAPFLTDPQLTDSNGLIDLVLAYASEALEPRSSSEPKPAEWYRERADVLDYAVSIKWKFPNGGMLSLLPSGRQGGTYAVRVNSFNWQNFYDRLGGHTFFEALKEAMRREFEFVLIDSRTGVSDTAGICTVQFPDSVIVCFTLNNQSIEGAAAVTRSVLQQKTAPDFDIFPIATRIDNSESDKLRERWQLAKQRFSDLPRSTPAADRQAYWDSLAVPYVPKFGYEEVLAAFANRPDDPANLNILANAMRLVETVFGVKALPETMPDPVRANVLHHYAGHAVSISPAEAQRLAEEARKREEVEKATVVAQARSELARKWRAVTAGIVLFLIAGLSGVVWYVRSKERAAQEQATLVAAEVKKAVTVADEATAGGNWPQALKSYTAGLALDPNNAALYAKRANVLAQLSRPDDELADWDRAIHLLPQDPQLLLGRAQARLRTGRAEGAMEDLRLLLNSDPSNVEALTLLARAQEDAGYIKEALATYSKLLESDATSPETIINRARVYQKLGDRQRAIADLQRATKLTQDPQLIAFAEAQLRELGVRPVVSPKPVEQIASVSVHFAVAQDRSVAEDLMKALQSQGLKAPSVVLKAGPVNGEVRYYYSQDLEIAARAKRTVEVELAKQRYFVSLELRLFDTKVLKASPGVIEVWLPQLRGKEASRAAPDIRDLNRRILR